MEDLAFFPPLAERQAYPYFRFHQHSYLLSVRSFSLLAVSQEPRKCNTPPGAGKHIARLGNWLEQLRTIRMGPLIHHELASLWLGPGNMPDLKCLTTRLPHNNGDGFRVILCCLHVKYNKTKSIWNARLKPQLQYKCYQKTQNSMQNMANLGLTLGVLREFLKNNKAFQTSWASSGLNTIKRLPYYQWRDLSTLNHLSNETQYQLE